jgi:hypothetical protein
LSRRSRRSRSGSSFRLKVGENIYLALKRKAELVDWRRAARRVTYALFSRSGFTERMRELAREEGVLLVHSDRLMSVTPGAGPATGNRG